MHLLLFTGCRQSAVSFFIRSVMIKRFVRYYKPYMWILWLVILGTCFSSVLDLLFPVVVRDIIQTALPASDLQLLWIDVIFCLFFMPSILQFSTGCSITDTV